MNFPFYIVDAFIDPDKSFSGNPAAIVFLADDNDICDETKQNIAAQFNLPATAFVSKLDGANQFMIRWFVTVREIKLCGHATMAASYVLFTETHRYSDVIQQDKPLKFETNFGTNLEATFDGHFVTLDFPLNAPVPIDTFNFKWTTELQEAILGKHGKESIVDVQYSPNKFVLMRLSEEIDIEQVKPDFGRMLQIDHRGSIIMAVITQKSNLHQTGVHFTTRSFGPWHQVNEDPVCGSACTVLTPYWAKVYGDDEVADGLLARHASERGGLVTNRMANDRVYLSGLAKIFSKGIIQL